MTRKIITATLLLALGYAAGTLTPHASAMDDVDRVVQELTRIRQELSSIKQALGRR